MPINTDLNVSPYYDDFDANNQYYRVLFRPSVAVQARELTQAQSILQNQVEQFGNWAFKNGDVVSGCKPVDDPVVPFVRLQDFQVNGASYDITSFGNLYAVSTTSNVTAGIIITTQGLESNYPNTNVLYLSYKNTGNDSTNSTSGDGSKYFSNNETLNIYDVDAENNYVLVAQVNTYANSTSGQVVTGNAHGIHVPEGVVFIQGAFVKVLNPTYGIVNNFGTYAGNNVVGFQLTETIVTENQDSSLLDNALGYTNENAPGAHRLKLEPKLVALDPTTATATPGFNPIAHYNYGALVSSIEPSANVYSILGNVMAKRTYEESGNYVVNPFKVDTVTSVAGNSVVASLDANSVLGRVSPGVGYVQGQRVELQKTAYINMRRGTDLQTNESQQIIFNYGGYFVLSEVAGSFAFDKAQSVDLYDAPIQAVTTRAFNSLTPAGTGANTITNGSISSNKIGTANLRCFTYNSGTVGSNNALYALHVFNIKLNAGYNTNQIQAVFYNGSTKAVGDVYIQGVQHSETKDQLYSFGVSGLKTLRNSTNAINTSYAYRTKSSNVMSTSGDVTITLSTGDELYYAIAGGGDLPDLDASQFTLIARANVDSGTLTGTVNVLSTDTMVKGNGTTFLSTYNTTDLIKVGSDVRTIISITNNTILNVDAGFSANANTQSYKKSYLSGKIIPISQSFTGPKSYIHVSNSTSFTINTNEIPSLSLNVDVVYDVKKLDAIPASKVIRKNRFVKLDTRTNPNGPWCLGFSDIHQVRGVYGNSSGFSTSLTDYSVVTSNFTFDTGQKDTHYDYGYLYPSSSYDANSLPYILVELDYFEANTASGVGFYTVESYPIDDANTANTTAIQTKDIPLYVDESGKKVNLRDYVDFRIPSNSTANNTGNCDTSNTTQVTASITAATQNPSSTLDLNVPVDGLNTPSYGKNFESDITFYLPRKDLVMITPDNVLKVKEGLSSLNPQTPLFPDNAMPLAIIDVPAYPSLSTDQLDSFLAVNKTSRSVIRDTSLGITTSNVTNRRYTMRDIGVLDGRVTNLEYYMALSVLEKKATDMTVTDANGLDRFKNGIFVDSMNDFKQSDVSNPEYTIAIDPQRGVARPRIIREVVNIDFKFADGTANQTGRAVTIPYTQVPFLVQPYSTKYRSSAHVSLAWNGTCVLMPPYDNHSDINNTGSINVTIDLAKPWQEFAQSPFGSIWGDWKTTSNTEVNTVTTGGPFIETVDLGYIGRFNTGNEASARIAATEQALAIIHERYGDNVTIGGLNLKYLSDIRLKKDISFLRKLANGLNLYKYRYLWSDIFYVGVMAQEVLNYNPDAVEFGADGYMRVNYGKINAPFATWSDWLNTSKHAV